MLAKGQWVVEVSEHPNQAACVRNQDRTIAMVWADDKNANARLIAAAPLMLEALKKIRHTLDNYDGQGLGTISMIAEEAIAEATE